MATAREIETWDSLLLRQEALEDVGVTKGRDRFLKALHKAESQGRPSQYGGAHSLLLKALTRIEEGIKEWKTMVNTTRGAKPVALKWLSMIEPEIAAYLTVKVLLDGLHMHRSVYSVSLQIASAIEDELVYREMRRVQPALFKYLMEDRGLYLRSYAVKKNILGRSMKTHQIDVAHLRIPKAEKIHVGSKCIDLAITVTGLFRVELVNIRQPMTGYRYRPNQKRDQWQVIPEPETTQWVEQKNSILQWLTPMALPMIVPPLPWAPGEPGGYRFGLRGKYDLVRGVSPEQQGVVALTEMPLVYQALNLVQATAWQINRKTQAIVEAIADAGGGFGGVPPLEPEAIPPKPFDIAENKESRKKWRLAARDTFMRNTLRSQVALKFHRIMREVQMVQDEATLFFPHNLDFRGRLYPIATYLSPQGEDLCKGLLTFAEGKPLGVEGAKALAVHGANCMDTDPASGEKLGQKTLKERQQWVDANIGLILSSAADPLGPARDWWTQADKPLQFLAFCFEWQQYQQHGPSYVCSLPVYVDGSCNGLQHFAAMFQDEIGGAAVNLTANERPADVYQRIADTTAQLCRELPPSHEDYQLGRRWLASGLLTRKLHKRPTMTFGYGSKVYGFQDQLLEYLSVDLRDSWEQTKKHFTLDGTASILQAARMLSRTIWEALGRNVVKAFEGMDWLQRCAKTVCAITKDGITWTVPITGFPVKQEYYVQQKKAVKTVLAGQVVRPTLYTPTAKPLLRKQQNAVSPNVIHSLDAAALMLAVDYAMKHGVTAFAAIHDSYGTIPADMPIVAKAARVGFHRLYTEHDIPRWLYDQFLDQMPTEEAKESLPLPPDPGTLDLDEVLESDYFFA